jgi:hypothetical protein
LPRPRRDPVPAAFAIKQARKHEVLKAVKAFRLFLAELPVFMAFRFRSCHDCSLIQFRSPSARRDAPAFAIKQARKHEVLKA